MFKSQETLRAGEAKSVVKSEEPKNDVSFGMQLIQESAAVPKISDNPTTTAAHAEKNNSPATTPSCGSTAESPLDAFDRMEEMIAVPVNDSEAVRKTPASTDNNEEKMEHMKGSYLDPPKLMSATPIFEAATSLSESAVNVVKEPPRS